MVRVEGPFTLLSPEETGRLRAMGVDLAHCRNWVVGGDGEALLAGIPGGVPDFEPVKDISCVRVRVAEGIVSGERAGGRIRIA